MLIELLTAPVSPETLASLVNLLLDCVEGGASIGFLAPLAKDEAIVYWHHVITDVSDGRRLILVARETPEGPVIGSAQLLAESRANGRHRAEIQKVLVLRPYRRRGLAAALVHRIEAEAQARRLTLLFLDTSDGPSGARPFYAFLGYTYVGGIPGYALDPDGTPAANAIYYKRLALEP